MSNATVKFLRTQIRALAALEMNFAGPNHDIAGVAGRDLGDVRERLEDMAEFMPSISDFTHSELAEIERIQGQLADFQNNLNSDRKKASSAKEALVSFLNKQKSSLEEVEAFIKAEEVRYGK